MHLPPEELAAVLRPFPGLRLALLFGSLARGTAGGASDIDLAILADRPLDADLRVAITGAVAERFGRAVDLVDLYAVPEPITGEALGGRRLLGDDAAQGELLYRHLCNVADFLPLRNRILDERRRAWTGS